MALGSPVTLRIEARALPLLPGAAEQVRAGNVPGGCRRNEEFLAGKVRYSKEFPRTSGDSRSTRRPRVDFCSPSRLSGPTR